MVKSPGEGLQLQIRQLIEQYPKGLSIEEIAKRLSISRTTAAKYLSAMEQSGKVELRPYGPAKVFSCSKRVPIDEIISLLPHLILVLNRDLSIIQVNTPLLTHLNLKREDLIGHDIRYSPLGQYLNEERIELLRQAISGTSLTLEEDLTLGENRFLFQVRIIPILLPDAGQGILLLLEDITTLKTYQYHLEELVAERTAELSDLNRQLQEEIRDRKEASRQYGESQSQYRQLVDNSTDLILKYSTDGVLTFHNSLAEEILGLRKNSRKRLNLLGTCLPDTPLWSTFASTLLSELPVDPELILRAEVEYPSGQPCWISWTFHCIRSLAGVSEILCIGTDITERVLSERRVRESEATLRRILAHLPDPTFVIGSDRKILFWNQAMEEMTGVPAREVIGKERGSFTPSIFGYPRPVLSDLIFEPDNEVIRGYFQDLSRDGEVLTAETRGIGKDGRERIFWSKASPLKDEAGTVTAAIQSLRDITLHQQMETELAVSECRVRGMLEASKDLILILDQEKKVLSSNHAYNRITGTETLMLRGLPISKAHLPGNPADWDLLLDTVIRTRLSNRVEIPAIVKDRDIWLDCYIIPYYPQNSRDLHILLDMRDITTLKTTAEPLWDDERTLQEISRQVSKILPGLGNQ